MNILWLCTDQQRFDSLGCYGNPAVDTPHIDALASRGTLFERCYSQSPVCAPSRAAFLTGRYPQVCGMYENGASISPHEVLVTRLLAQNGFTCGLSGKLHLSVCNPAACPDMEPRIDDGYSAFHWSHHPEGDWPLNDYHIWLDQRGQLFAREPLAECPWVQRGMPREYHHSAYCADRARSFIRAHGARGGGRSWLFSVNFFDPHHAFDPPGDLLDKYMARLGELPEPNYVEGELDDKPVFQRIDHQGAYGGNAGHPFAAMTPRQRKLHTAAYLAMVEMIDTQVGLLVETLKETGQYEDTLIVFTSDHGEMLGDHGIYLKGPYFYDCAVRVPLILHWPGRVAAGLRSRALVELVDLPQTLLDAAGLPHAPGMMGKSLWDICAGKVPAERHRDFVFCEYYNAMPWHSAPTPKCAMVFDGRYKLVRCHGLEDGELYDLEADPSETRNRWSAPEYAGEKLRLLGMLCDKLADMRDPAYKRVADW